MRFAAGSSAAAARQFSARSISSSIEYLLWLILHHPFSGVLPREADERLKSRTYQSRSSGQLRREGLAQACAVSDRLCAMRYGACAAPDWPCVTFDRPCAARSRAGAPASDEGTGNSRVVRVRPVHWRTSQQGAQAPPVSRLPEARHRMIGPGAVGVNRGLRPRNAHSRHAQELRQRESGSIDAILNGEAGLPPRRTSLRFRHCQGRKSGSCVTTAQPASPEPSG